MKRIILASGMLALLCRATVLESHAVELINNGGFESGLTGWTTADQVGSEGSFVIQNGTTSPVLGLPVPAPAGGVNAAMTDAAAGGSHVLYQSFLSSGPVASATLAFDLFIGNRAQSTPAFSVPQTLDWATPTLNQQARVDILSEGLDPFSLASVLLNLFQTQENDAALSGYTHYSLDITSLLNANLNQTLVLRFAEVDNVDAFQFGVDNVSLEAIAGSAVPEGSAFIPGLLTIAGMCWMASRSSRHSHSIPLPLCHTHPK